jgi:hypothetical protein
MSCTTTTAWSHHVLSLCCTEHGSSRSVVLLGRITSIAISRSGQLGRRYTIELHCSACTSAVISVMHERTLETHKPSYVARTAKPFFILVVHNPLGGVGHVAIPELPSQEGRA